MSDAVVVAAIGAIAGIISAIFAGRANHNAKRSRDQVENDHTNNFREENDTRHAETIARFDKLGKSIGGIRDDVRVFREDHSDLAERVHDLEKIEMRHPRPKGTEQ